MRAAADRAAVFDYISKRSPVGARSVIGRLDQTLDLLAEHPRIGQRASRGDVRVVGVGSYPYNVFYRIEGDEVLILHIRHMSRRASEFE